MTTKMYSLAAGLRKAALALAGSLVLLLSTNATAQVPTNIEFVCDTWTNIVGNGPTCTVTVSAGTSGANLGTAPVQIWDGPVLIRTTTVSWFLSKFTTTVSLSNLSPDLHPVRAVYVGDSATLSSTSPTYTVTLKDRVHTRSTLSCVPNRIVVGQVSTCTASIATDEPLLVNLPGGSVSLVGSSALGEVTVNSAGSPGNFNAVMKVPTSLGVGTHQLLARYHGQVSTLGSDSPATTLTIDPAVATTTALSCTPSTIPVGGSTVCAVTVSSATAMPSIGGKAVQILDGANVVATTTPLTAGTGVGSWNATATVKGLTGGVHSLTARYAGEVSTQPSVSAGFTVTQIPPAVTTTGLIATPMALQAGQSVTLQATVTGNHPGSNVVFKDGAATLATVPLNAGVASTTQTLASAGTHSITAVYGGDTVNGASTSAAALVTVNKRTTTTTLANDPLLTEQGAVTLKATVTGFSPSGTVDFLDAGTKVGSAPLVGNVATLAVSLTNAPHTLVANYLGDANNAASSSVPSQLVMPAPISPAPVVNYEYDAQGNPTKTVQAPEVPTLNLTTKATYDGLGRAKDSTDAKSKLTKFGYDGLDRTTLVTDPRALDTKYSRNGLGDVTQLTSPDTGTATHTYDAAGNLKTRLDSRGVLATYSYDAESRLTGVVYSKAGSTSLSFTNGYDMTGVDYGAGIGRLSRTDHPNGATRYVYSVFGEVTTDAQRINAAAGANSANVVLSTSYTYDAVGHLTGITYPSGRKVAIGYTSGQVTSLGLAKDAGSAATPLISAIQWEPFGGVKGWQWNLSTGLKAHNRTYDLSGRVVRYPLGGVYRDLRYDEAGRIKSYTHLLSTNGAAQAHLDQSFGYDELGRITGVAVSGANWTIGYDDNGNRTGVTLSGVASTYTTPATSNKLASITNPARTFGYDAAGNTTQDTGKGFTATYDLAGRLETLTKGTVVTRYTYDGLGRRIRKVSSTGAASTVLFAYGQDGQLLGEYDANGKALREYVWLGSTPIAIFTPDPANAANPPLAYYVHADHLNTPRIVVDRSGTGRWTWLAEPFGTTAPDTNPKGLGVFTQNLRFPGQYADQESGLYYNMARYYDSSGGRYTTSDPIGLGDGVNTYAYASSNPARFVDPSGLARFFDMPDGFHERLKWVRSHRELVDANSWMREKIKSTCGKNKEKMLSIFDNWLIVLDPNIDNFLRRARGTYATTSYSAQKSQFNYSFFHLDETDPSAIFIFSHEFRHLMKKNNNLTSSSGLGSVLAGKPDAAPYEKDADAWANNFISGICTCEDLE